MHLHLRWSLSKYVVLSASLFVTVAAYADDWREIRRTTDIVIGLDAGGIRRSGSIVEAAMVTVPKDNPLGPSIPYYDVIDFRVDCSASTAQILGSKSYFGTHQIGSMPGDQQPSQSRGGNLDVICGEYRSLPAGAETAFDFAQGAWRGQ